MTASPPLTFQNLETPKFQDPKAFPPRLQTSQVTSNDPAGMPPAGSLCF